jgi:TPR repeat protein
MKINTFVIFLVVLWILSFRKRRPRPGASDHTQMGLTRVRAENGDAEAQFALGYFYATGQGVAHDEAEAVKWYRRAAEQNLATAQFNLATCYDNGQGVEKNTGEAVKWYRRAADQNLADAQFHLGACYQHGDGVSRDDVEGYKWFLVASEQGFLQAREAAAKLEAALSPGQIAEGKRRAGSWLAQHKKS